jgi:hypothetical protein
MSSAHEATKAAVARREPYLQAGLAARIKQDRTQIFLKLCGVPMSATEAEFFITLVEEGLASLQPKK